MPSYLKPKCIESIKGKSINNKARSLIEIPEYLFVSNYQDWDIGNIVNDYFLFIKNPLETGHTLYSEATEYLQKLVDSTDCVNKSEKAFVSKFLNYFIQPRSKKTFLEIYRNAERDTRLKASIVEVEEEVEITSNELVGDNLRNKSQKRKLADVTDVENRAPLKLNVKSKKYTIQSPNTVVPSNSPVIEDDNISKIIERVDICLTTNTTLASTELLDEYKLLQAEHRKNKNISSITSAINLFQQFTEINKDNALIEIPALACDNHKFNQFMKFSLIDYTINTMRITSTPLNDERTMYVENIVPLFKYFSNITGLMSFTWCERKDKVSASSIFFVTKEKSSAKLLDGIGSNDRSLPCIVIESSGLKITADIDHTLEDSIKNIKSATDAIKNIMCKFPNASINTIKRVHVYSAQVIQSNITLIKYSLKDKKTFKAVECCSSVIPTTYEEKNYMISVFDMFAYLYNDLKAQVEVFKLLEKEQLGFIEVADKEMVCFNGSNTEQS